MGEATCQSCGGGLRVFYEVRGVPVHSCLMVGTEREALAFRKGDLALGFCARCGFVQNVLFDPTVHEYSERYEETQAFSPRFNRFAEELARDLVERFDVRGKTVLEIGCGKGEFLCLLCELGECDGIGFDPGYRPERTTSAAAQRIRFVRDFWSEAYADVTADFWCCRHTLEHIPDVARFVRLLRSAIGDRTDALVFFEVPDLHRVLEERAFWDVYYEHCSYFTAGSLARLFRACGFDLLDLRKAFDDQYLLLVARPGDGQGRVRFPAEDDLAEVGRAVEAFAADCPRAIESWRARLGELARSGRRAVLWGSGSKAVAFLTTTGLRDEVGYVVDINPHKHGMRLAGSGHEIVAPSFLAEYRPDLVLLMNPAYRDEVRRQCAELGVQADLGALGEP